MSSKGAPMFQRRRDRRRALRAAAAVTGGALLAGCERPSGLGSVIDTLRRVEDLSRVTQKALAPRSALAQEFDASRIAKTFRSNGTLEPPDADYLDMRQGGFADFRLTVGGLVERPATYTLAELRALPSRTQITRHDCVEGWSCIGKWKGVPLAFVLEQARPLPQAKYVVFRCFDSMASAAPGDPDPRYYESIDFDDAYHPQTLLAYELNDQALPVANGAPLRCRVERQLGYKHAKYVRAIELVESFANIRGGKGGYWEDLGYEWYAGI